MLKNWFIRATVAAVAFTFVTSCSFHRKKYENPITKDTVQPDKVLFDKAIGDIERGRYEVARLTLQTMINTYDSSEYMAKAKLAIADSWFREGGSHGLAQAEAEYKDFILFYPTLEEAAESQQKICMIHYRQMEKADRDLTHALRAEDECRQLLVQFPNSKFAPEAQQRLREIQEAIADSEFRVGTFYHGKGSNPAAANRLNQLVEQYPLYSKADEALWQTGDAYSKMGPRFRQKSGEAFARIVKDYPLSPYVDAAKKKLNQLEIPVPQADAVAYARMKYELDNRNKKGITSQVTGIMKRGPDLRTAAKSGTPAMTSLRPSIPASVPTPAATGPGFSAEVSASTVSDPSVLDKNPDARQNPPVAGEAPATLAPATPVPGSPEAAQAAAPAQPLPVNRPAVVTKKQKKVKKGKNAPAAVPQQPAAPETPKPAQPETPKSVQP